MSEVPPALRPGAVSRWTRDITEEDIRRFGELSGDTSDFVAR